MFALFETEHATASASSGLCRRDLLQTSTPPQLLTSQLFSSSCVWRSRSAISFCRVSSRWCLHAFTSTTTTHRAAMRAVHTCVSALSCHAETNRSADACAQSAHVICVHCRLQLLVDAPHSATIPHPFSTHTESQSHTDCVSLHPLLHATHSYQRFHAEPYCQHTPITHTSTCHPR